MHLFSACPATASAAQVTREDGVQAVTNFRVDAAGGPIQIEAGGADVLIHDPPGPGVPASVAFAILGGPDLSADCFGEITGPDFAMQDVNSATLNATIPCYDHLGGPSFDITFSLEWTGYGDIFNVNNTEHFRTPDLTYTFQYDALDRLATPSGTVSFLGQTYSPTNAYPSGTSLERFINGVMIIE